MAMFTCGCLKALIVPIFASLVLCEHANIRELESDLQSPDVRRGPMSHLAIITKVNNDTCIRIPFFGDLLQNVMVASSAHAVSFNQVTWKLVHHGY